MQKEESPVGMTEAVAHMAAETLGHVHIANAVDCLALCVALMRHQNYKKAMA